MSSISDFLFGHGDKFSQQSTLDPNQQNFLQNLFQQLGGMGGQGGSYGNAQNYLSQLLSGDQNAFSQFEAPYRQQFEQQTLPGIAERFAGANPMGGGLSSSGFGQALGGAGAGLQAQLAGLHGNLRNQAVGQSLGQFNQLAGLGLGTRSFENIFQPGNYGALGGALQGVGQGFGQGLGMAAGGGNPFGAISSGISSLFNRGGNRQGWERGR